MPSPSSPTTVAPEAIEPSSGGGGTAAGQARKAPALGGDRFGLILLAAALLLGLLRFVRLGRWSLWLDEVYTWGDSHSQLAGNYNDLGYHMVRWFVATIGGGPTEVALRMLPALAGFFCVPLTYWAFRPLAGSRRAALAAVAVAVSPWQIQWAQTARFYTLCEFMVLLGSGLAIRALYDAKVLRAILGLVVVGAGVLFQLQGAVIAGGLGAAAALCWPGSASSNEVATHQRQAARRAFGALAAIGLVGAPFIWGAWRRYANDKAVDDALGSVAHFVLASASFATPAILAMAGAGWLIGACSRDRRVHFVGAAIVTPTLVLAIAATQAVVTAQYVFALFPWLALAAAWPIGDARLKAVPGFSIAWPATMVLPLLTGTGLYMTVEHGQRARWREATHYVMERMRPGDLVAANPAPVVEFYLTGATETDVRSADTVLQMGRWSPRSWETWAKSGRRMWLIIRPDYLFEMSEEDRQRVKSFLAEDCRRVATFPVHVEARDLGIDVWRFDG